MDTTRWAVKGCIVAAVAATIVSATTVAGADHEDGTIYACVSETGAVRIVGARESCRSKERSEHWSRYDTDTTYQAGDGLRLSADNTFSLGDVGWSDLLGVPSELADGDDDGSSGLAQLRSSLATSDQAPNQVGDLVSWSKLLHVPTDLQDGDVSFSEVSGEIQASMLAGRYENGLQTVVGAVTSDKIADGAVERRDLASGVASWFADLEAGLTALERRLAGLADPPAPATDDRISTRRLVGNRTLSVSVDPSAVLSMTRAEEPVGGLDGVGPEDFVTVSPPADLAHQLLFVGHDVRSDGIVLYLYNNSSEPVDDAARTWTVRHLDLTP